MLSTVTPQARRSKSYSRTNRLIGTMNRTRGSIHGSITQSQRDYSRTYRSLAAKATRGRTACGTVNRTGGSIHSSFTAVSTRLLAVAPLDNPVAASSHSRTSASCRAQPVATRGHTAHELRCLLVLPSIASLETISMALDTASSSSARNCWRDLKPVAIARTSR